MLALALTASLLAAAPAAPSLDSLRDLLRPTAEELRYQEIPWHNTLEGAINEARASNKPLLVWIENGHPLAGV